MPSRRPSVNLDARCVEAPCSSLLISCKIVENSQNVQIVHEKVIDLDVKYLFAIIYIYVFQAFTFFFIY